MTARLFISKDSASVAVGADELATAVANEAARRGLTVEIVRTGSRGLYWTEPMVEVDTPNGRISYGPVAADQVSGLFDAGLLDGHATEARLGMTEDIPFLKQPGPFHIRPVRDYRSAFP